MKVDVVMPKMGESLQEGTILKWLKKPGDIVERDEMILEISTDKVDTEVPAPNAGVLSRIFAQENETVEVGKVIAEIETDITSSSVQSNAPVAPKQVEEIKAPVPDVKAVVQTAAAGSLIDVVMPKMGESLQEGTILKWLKKPGDTIERDEMILEISTDKVDTELPSPVAGVLHELLYNENDTIEVGKVIARINTSGGVIVTANKPDSSRETTKTIIPKIEQPQAQVTSQQTVQSAPAATVNVPEGSIDIPREAGGKFYSPLVRSIAQVEGITVGELDKINGTGIEGRVNKNDVLNYLKTRGTSPTVTTTVAQPAPVQVKPAEPAATQPTPVFSVPAISGSDSEIIPMDRVRQLISEHMVYSKRTSAHVTSVAEADVTTLVKFRDKFKNDFEKKEGFKLTYTPFFCKGVIDGVKAFPRINVSVDGKNIILHRRVNLSVATALENGNLIVPVIKSADAMSITGLARSVYDLANRARTKKLNPDDIQDGTITLTNVGTFGTLFGTPVINQPQTAIIGVGAIKKRPVVREMNGEDVIVIRHMMYVSITYDHRVIDGMLAGQALAAIVRSFESMNESTITL